MRNKEINGKDAEIALGLSNITVNKNMVPFDTQSPFITSGIRIGSPAITTRGLKESEMDKVVEFIDESLFLFKNDKCHKDLSVKVNSFMKNYPIFKI